MINKRRPDPRRDWAVPRSARVWAVPRSARLRRAIGAVAAAGFALGAAGTAGAGTTEPPPDEDTLPSGSTMPGASSVPGPAPDAGSTGFYWEPNADLLAAAEDEVNVIAWAGYVEDGSTNPEVDWVTPFEDITGCAVNVQLGNTSDEMVQLMQSGEYDGVSASGDATERLIAGGEVGPLDVSQM